MNRKGTLAKLWGMLNFSLELLPDRIRLQKSVYILARLGYPGLDEYLKDYSFYIHGPYSSMLAKDAYELNEKTQAGAALPLGQFGSAENGKLELFRGLMECVKKSGNKAQEYAEFELVADIIYFCTSVPAPAGEELFRKLMGKKAYFNDRAKFEAAADALKKIKAI